MKQTFKSYCNAIVLLDILDIVHIVFVTSSEWAWPGHCTIPCERRFGGFYYDRRDGDQDGTEVLEPVFNCVEFNGQSKYTCMTHDECPVSSVGRASDF